MGNLYKDTIKENNKKVKELTGEYKLNCEKFVKEIREYAIQTLNTEQVISEMIEELYNGYNKNIRFSTLVDNKNDYLNNYKAKCYKGAGKQSFTLKEKIGIVFFLIIAAAFTIITIYLQQPVSFDIPTNIEITENVLSFDKVEYAEKYMVLITDVNDKKIYEKEIKTTTLDLSTISEIDEVGTYKIKVRVQETSVMEESKWSEVVIYYNGGN